MEKPGTAVLVTSPFRRPWDFVLRLHHHFLDQETRSTAWEFHDAVESAEEIVHSPGAPGRASRLSVADLAETFLRPQGLGSLAARKVGQHPQQGQQGEQRVRQHREQQGQQGAAHQSFRGVRRTKPAV